ncbi:hypothetical protein MMPV_005950 [Pyropia vietnamensis]
MTPVAPGTTMAFAVVSPTLAASASQRPTGIPLSLRPGQAWVAGRPLSSPAAPAERARPARRQAAATMAAPDQAAAAAAAAAAEAAAADTHTPANGIPPPAEGLDWATLGFQFRPTNCYVRYTYRDGEWSSTPELVTEPYIKLHIGATALHYGASCFEGLKAFRAADGRVSLFRPDENAKRMASSAARLLIPEVPADLFLSAVKTAVRENIEFVPPYGTGGSLYVRPLLFGSGPKIGLSPADEFTFLVLVTPVGDYYAGGSAPVTAVVTTDYDRAAPRGVGHVKVAGNYAADLLPNTLAKRAGYPINLYVDAENQRSVEEFGTSNFVGIRGNTYVTPNSPSVLPSVTNKTLATLAVDAGMVVERRPVDIEEVGEFDEVAACGTAVVITAVTRIVYKDKVIVVGKEVGADPEVVGPRFAALYKQVRGIQCGELPDVHGWCFDVYE